MWKEMSCFICWELWRHRNLIIFEDQNLSLSRVCNRKLLDLGEMEKVHIVHSQRIVRPPFLEGNLDVRFFDGAS